MYNIDTIDKHVAYKLFSLISLIPVADPGFPVG